VFETTILRTSGFWPVNVARSPTGRFSITHERYEGIIWCPSLKHHNWLARREGTMYYTGNTELVSLRVDVTSARLVAYERMQRLSWPYMVSRFEARIGRYGADQSMAAHDGTGLGDVVDGYLTVTAEKVILSGRPRSDIFSNSISAIERHAVISPYAERPGHAGGGMADPPELDHGDPHTRVSLLPGQFSELAGEDSRNRDPVGLTAEPLNSYSHGSSVSHALADELETEELTRP
jgi:hypothetical protein